ncbi:hypothetical protein POL67_03480 [Polyangium sp. rjm3]|uniref:Uncharacterized protein n=1 Tax=Polyangium mundeleinium TaxID=2995306 RepID=A0ABT5EGC1_9BACT|nr:hypothetical protein [Polyangium mundeleinium]MDC0740392.1 hypothetical protein [Polyangium mundeleinium]
MQRLLLDVIPQEEHPLVLGHPIERFENDRRRRFIGRMLIDRSVDHLRGEAFEPSHGLAPVVSYHLVADAREPPLRIGRDVVEVVVREDEDLVNKVGHIGITDPETT